MNSFHPLPAAPCGLFECIIKICKKWGWTRDYKKFCVWEVEKYSFPARISNIKVGKEFFYSIAKRSSTGNNYMSLFFILRFINPEHFKQIFHSLILIRPIFNDFCSFWMVCGFVSIKISTLLPRKGARGSSKTVFYTLALLLGHSIKSIFNRVFLVTRSNSLPSSVNIISLSSFLLFETFLIRKSKQ